MEVVVDANVWAHADNEDVSYVDACVLLCSQIASTTFVLCVDGGWSMDDTNRSRIGVEYQDWVRVGSLGYHAIVWLASNERVVFIENMKPSDADRQAIAALLPNNKHDRHYLRLVICTADRLFISHDYEDFTDEVRDACESRWGVRILEIHDLIALEGLSGGTPAA